MLPRSPRSSRPAGRRLRPRPPRRRGSLIWWLILAILVAIAIYLILPRLGGFFLPLPRRVGIVAGHWQYDSGATCPDGLLEVDITLPIARLVVQQLKERGYEAEILPEYSDRLSGYRAIALVSLHVDSCIPGFSGFKAAGSSARLVESLTRSYAAATGLEFHANTITPAMTRYYAFDRIAPETPGAIVEMGFMADDREFLTTQQDQVARGIVEGIITFLTTEDGAPPAADPTHPVTGASIRAVRFPAGRRSEWRSPRIIALPPAGDKSISLRPGQEGGCALEP